jgi:hypothetical protein
MKFWDFTPGQTRYIHVYLIFPDDTFWVKCLPFAHPVSFEAMNRFKWHKTNPDALRKLVATGEASVRDEAGVTTRMLIKEEPIEEHWGMQADKRRAAREKAEQGIAKIQKENLERKNA